ncbi:MAG TPA: sugar ABC transporter ATP-binding protein [Gemmataceae bacterium]|nr:sugar ABC transporter ATP-binding protein [Gemmataceae bacterium]
MTKPPLLDVRDIRKHFAGVHALDGVSMAIRSNEVLAIVGENGAGKSTLMKILAGVHRPDGGEIIFEGQPVHLHGVRDALRRGIILIHQELNLAENLSVAANLFLGREEVIGGPIGWLNNQRMDAEARALLTRVGLDVRPDRRVGDLPPGQRQLVEIARALGQDARLIIMDEPTSSLTQSETDRLYEVIDDLRAQGIAVVYISHRLAEVLRVADRVEVLRDGRNAGGLAKNAISRDAMIRLMVGRDLKGFYQRRHQPSPDSPVRLEVRDVVYAGGPPWPASFVVRGGEIVGMAGLVGAGRTELAEALFGLRRITGGEVQIDGAPLRADHPRDAIRAGLLLAPEDRRRHGLILADSVESNLCLPNLARLCALGPLAWVIPSRAHRLTCDLTSRLSVKASGPNQIVGQLSGGNQQKVVLGKWLAGQPRVVIFDEPTRGVDVGARSEIYGLMDGLAAAGVAVVMISSDLEEVLGMSDRVLVLHEGRVAGELPRTALSQEAVMRLATGGGTAAGARETAGGVEVR